MKKLAAVALVSTVLNAALIASLFAAGAGKTDTTSASSSAGSTSHSGGGGRGAAPSAPVSHGGGGGTSAPSHSGGGGPSGPTHRGGGGFGSGGGSHPFFPYHPGGYDGYRYFHGGDHDFHARERDSRDYYDSIFQPDFGAQTHVAPRRWFLPVGKTPADDHQTAILPSPSLPNPTAADLAALAHAKPVAGARWLPVSAHPHWDKTQEHIASGLHYRWYANGWLVVDQSFWPPDNYGFQQVVFVVPGVDTVVADVQSKLRFMDYYEGAVDGSEGPLTREAIQKYQRYKGLPATGTINKPLLIALGMG